MAELRHNLRTRFEARKAVWLNADSFATTLLTLFIDTYGTEAFDWDPKTIENESVEITAIAAISLSKMLRGSLIP